MVKQTARWVVSLLIMASGLAVAADDNGIEVLRRTSRAFAEVAKKVTPAVVAVQVEQVSSGGQQEFNSPFDDEFFRRFFGPNFRQPQPRQPEKRVGQGSGFIISPEGYILTNNHVVDSADKITVVLKDGRKLDAKTIGTDPESEVALIKVDAKDLPTIELGDSDSLEIGEWVIAVGNPFGLAETVTVGIVSAKGRQIGLTEGGYEDFIQTDAAINPGNSGGPLLDIDGRAIGINTAIISQSGGYMGIGLAVPINMAKAVKDQLMASGKVTRSYVGIMMNPDGITQELAESFGLKDKTGILITDVEKDSPADKAGIKQGDIILQYNGKPITNNESFRNAIALLAPGTEIKLQLFRDGKTVDKKVVVASRQDSQWTSKVSDVGRKLGIGIGDIDDAAVRQFNLRDKSGVVVTEVKPNTPAADAGIEAGMVILSVNRTYVNSVADFNEALKETEESGRAVLLVKTGRFSQYVVLKLK